MTQNDAVLEIFLEKVRRDYAQDVGLVFLYGSMVNESAHEKSDIDLVFVPQTRRADELAMSFIVGDIGYDFFPMRWDRLERIASFEDPLTAVLAGARVVYASARTHEERFEQLRGWIIDALDAPLGLTTLDRAKAQLDSALQHAARMQLADGLSEARLHAGGALIGAMQAVCTMNNRIFWRGSSHWLEELAPLRDKPEDFAALCTAVAEAGTLAALRKAVWALLGPVQRQHARLDARLRPLEPAAKVLEGTYEESRCNWQHKIRRACASGDTMSAFLAGVAYQDLLRELRTCVGLPPMDVLGHFAPDNLPAFGDAVETSYRDYRTEMLALGIPLREYASVADFRAALLD